MRWNKEVVYFIRRFHKRDSTYLVKFEGQVQVQVDPGSCESRSVNFQLDAFEDCLINTTASDRNISYDAAAHSVMNTGYLPITKFKQNLLPN